MAGPAKTRRRGLIHCADLKNGACIIALHCQSTVDDFAPTTPSLGLCVVGDAARYTPAGQPCGGRSLNGFDQKEQRRPRRAGGRQRRALQSQRRASCGIDRADHAHQNP